MAAVALRVDFTEPVSAVTLVNVEQIAQRYGRRVPEVYAALREGRLPGHKAGKWNWVCFDHELPEQWPEEEVST